VKRGVYTTMRKRRVQIVPHLILILLSLVMIVPLYWVLKTSLTGENLFAYPPSLIPQNPHVFYFIDVYNWIPFMRYFYNSVLVSVLVVLANVVLNSMAGFALRYTFPGKRLIILTYLSCTMIPFQTTIIPAFLLTKHMGLINTHFGLALPLMSTIINIFVFKASFDAVPSSLYDAAKIDGMADWKMLFRIFLPLSKAAVGTNIILSFIWSWNNFIWPLIIINEREMQTLPLGLARFLSYFEDTSGQMYAFVLMVIAPVIAIFLLNQKRFISGVLSGAVKG
jgi:ABC-type glycerol-3-phosphate transport system permease component